MRYAITDAAGALRDVLQRRCMSDAEVRALHRLQAEQGDRRVHLELSDSPTEKHAVRVNVQGTRKVLDAARRKQVPKVVYTTEGRSGRVTGVRHAETAPRGPACQVSMASASTS
jgi:nucleoside-diphosphate-sugar epimerase